MVKQKSTINICTLFLVTFLLTACGGGGDDGDSSGGGGSPSNMARFTFDCDLNGVIGVLTMDVEAVGSTGIVFGSGPNPDITAVIGTGDFNLFTEGELLSPQARYIFTGTNQFADFTETATFERFRVQWVEQQNGLKMIINPFGPQPTEQFCSTTGASFI